MQHLQWQVVIGKHLLRLALLRVLLAIVTLSRCSCQRGAWQQSLLLLPAGCHCYVAASHISQDQRAATAGRPTRGLGNVGKSQISKQANDDGSDTYWSSR